MPRSNTFGKINKKTKQKLKDNGKMGGLATSLRNSIKILTGEQKGCIKPKQQIAEDYLDLLIAELENRFENLRDNKPFPPPKKIGVCTHPTTLGSSQIRKLLSDQQLTLFQFHGRLYGPGARLEGRIYEKYFEELNGDTYEADGLIIEDIIDQVSCYSLKLPWVIATPDFICKVRETRDGPSFLAIVEIKSTASAKTFKHSQLYHSTQVQVAMDCFGIKKGYLVTYLVDDKKGPEDSEVKVEKLDYENFLTINAINIRKKYALFLQKSIKELTAIELSLKIIDEKLITLVSDHQRQFTTLDEIKALPKPADRAKCYFSRAYNHVPAKTYKKKRLEAEIVGNPQNRINNCL